MRKLWQSWQSFLHHFKLFGPGGASFFLKQRWKKEGLIDITMKGYAHPIYMRNHTSDVPMFYYIFEAKEYDISFPFEPKVIIDCGAHIGLGAVFFAHKFPNAIIYSIEPEKSNFELLVKNTEAYPNIRCLNYGIWNKTTNLKILDVGLGNWGYMTEEVSCKDETTIEAISIDEIMNRYGISQIDICKVNIEGTEKELFEQNTEKWLPHTKAIIIELHDRMREGCTKSFFKALMNYNFSISPHGSYLVCTLQ